MYSRTFNPDSQKNYGNIPVQSFEDSFSTDAFLEKNSAGAPQRENPPEPPEIQETAAGREAEKPACLSQERHTSRHFAADDYLLLGLLLLFLSDSDRKDDILIPVLLAILLLS